VGFDEYHRRFDETLAGRSGARAEGTPYTVDAEVGLRMPYALPAPLRRGLARRRMRRFVREPVHAPAARVARTPPLRAVIDGRKPKGRVEVKRIERPADLRSGVQLHPCAVAGAVVGGLVLFQVAGEEPRVLMPGDAFREPAGARVAHFDARSPGATRVANYLLGPGEHELITPLD
jgi:hypothetical protein